MLTLCKMQTKQTKVNLTQQCASTRLYLSQLQSSRSNFSKNVKKTCFFFHALIARKTDCVCFNRLIKINFMRPSKLTNPILFYFHDQFRSCLILNQRLISILASPLLPSISFHSWYPSLLKLSNCPMSLSGSPAVVLL
jgi:hypothetical protein